MHSAPSLRPHQKQGFLQPDTQKSSCSVRTAAANTSQRGLAGCAGVTGLTGRRQAAREGGLADCATAHSAVYWTGTAALRIDAEAAVEPAGFAGNVEFADVFVQRSVAHCAGGTVSDDETRVRADEVGRRRIDIVTAVSGADEEQGAALGADKSHQAGVEGSQRAEAAAGHGTVTAVAATTVTLCSEGCPQHARQTRGPGSHAVALVAVAAVAAAGKGHTVAVPVGTAAAAAAHCLHTR